MSKTPSIAVIPSGYKASKVYSVLPTNGDADLDFTRNCVATRVNQNGLLEEVGLNVPRLDYSDGGCPSLLLEPNRTNLVTYSEDFSQWSNVESSISSNIEISPKGDLTADKLIPNATNTSNHYASLTATVLDATTYTMSFFAKKGEYDFVSTYSNAFSSTATWDLNNGTIILDSLGTAKIEDVGNGWYKCSLTGTTSTTVFNYRIYTSPFSDRGTSFLGDGVSGVYIFGAQLEEGSYATSYIPTSGTEVTRFKDEASKDNLESYINSSEGVLYAEIKSFTETIGTSSYITISDGTYANRASILFSSGALNSIRTFLRVGGAVQSDGSGSVTSLKEFNKVAFSYKNNEFKTYINGSLAYSDTIGSVWSANTINTLSFSEIGTSSGAFQGKTKDIRVYNEALTDAELIELTTI